MTSTPSPTEAALAAFFHGTDWRAWDAKKKADALTRMAAALEAARSEWHAPALAAALEAAGLAISTEPPASDATP